MRKLLYNILFLLCLLASFEGQARQKRDTILVGSGMTFTENLGQWVEPFAFKTQMNDATLFLEHDCFTFVVAQPVTPHHHGGERPHHEQADRRFHAYQVQFVGSDADTLTGVGRQEQYENYFLGKDSGRWRGHVGLYHEVDYQNLYPGIRLKVYSASNAMKYDFVVAPHADPSNIAMLYKGADKVYLNDGDLIVHTSALDIVELKPYVYQMIEGKTLPVEAQYLLKDNVVTFKLGDYNPDYELIIDPYLYFSTYTGSGADNWGTTATYDSHKRTYTAGLVFGSGYPTSLGAYDRSANGSVDVGIFVFNETGSQRIYATYLGGQYADMPHSMYVNDLDELVIFGTTGSRNFPVTPTAYDTSFNGGSNFYYEGPDISYPYGSDIFVSRFSQDGSQLMASTYIGGSGNDGLNFKNSYNAASIMMNGNDSLYFNYGDGARGELITDDLANVYVGSTTFSTDFPTTELSFQPTAMGKQEGVVFKLDYNLSNMLWSSYIGGSENDAVYSIDVDKDYNLYVCGGTSSSDFPVTSRGYRRLYRGGSADGFISKISYYGTTLMASTFFGSSHYDQCYFVRMSRAGDTYVFGQTKSTGSYLVTNAQFHQDNSGQFLARFAPNLDSIRWSTLFGSGRGEPDISPTAFAVDVCDRVYAVGWGRIFSGQVYGNPWYTYGTHGLTTTPDAYQDSTDGQDFYIFGLDNQASRQDYGSFFGELHSAGNEYGGQDHVDGGTSRFDRCATLYQSVCASCGHSQNFPTTDSAWSVFNESSNCNNAVFRFNVSNDFPVADFPQPAVRCASSTPYTFTFTGRADRVQWNYGDGTSDQGVNARHDGSHVYSTPGIYRVQLISYMDTGCHPTDTVERTLYILGGASHRLDTLSTCTNAPVQIGIKPVLGASYRWIQGQVSDSTISNPYVNQSGEYVLLISTDGSFGGPACTDTIRQYVKWGVVDFEFVTDTLTCSSPIRIAVSSEQSGISYCWSYHADFRDTINRLPLMTSITVEPTEPFNIYVSAKDEYGCENTDSIHIEFYRVVDTLLGVDSRCAGSCEGTITVVHNNAAVAPYTYTCDGVSGTDSIISDLCAGLHTVVFSDANGCAVTKRISIVDPPTPLISHNTTHIHCFEPNSGSVELEISRGRAPYSVTWSNGAQGTVIEDLEPGTYIATVSDSAGCLYYDTAAVLNSVNSFDNIEVWADDSVVFVNLTTQLHASGCEECTYLWQPVQSLDDASAQNPTATIKDTTLFIAMLTDTAGCTYYDSVKVCCIMVDCGRTSLFIPNAFTPNGDGKNDQLCFRNQFVTSFEFHLFSRWGEEVYRSTDIDECWDGRFRNQLCQPGVYTYYCKITCEGDQEATFKGDITLIR